LPLILLLLLSRTCNRLRGQTPEAWRRREGDALYIECSYAAQTEYQNTKYWRLLKDRRYQEVVHIYSERSKQSRDGRTKITDDTTSRTVSITMTDLKAEDSGTYSCAIYKYSDGYIPLRTISLNVFKGSSPKVASPPPAPALTRIPKEEPDCCNGNTFIILSVVLFILLLLALLTSIALGVRHYKLLLRTGNREAENTRDRPEGTAQPGSTGRRESSQDDSKGLAYINLDVQSQPSPEDPLYCNVEPSQAHRSPQHVEYAVIAFSQSPRTGRE
ncbi:TREM1 protein, partial [Irena cyanogastra]|nr:TREM1 protein [Irena cyanogastra]